MASVGKCYAWFYQVVSHGLSMCGVGLLQLGMGWSAAAGTGVVVARRQEGGWSPPSAIALLGVGWGLQLGGAVSNILIVLRNRCVEHRCNLPLRSLSHLLDTSSSKGESATTLSTALRCWALCFTAKQSQVRFQARFCIWLWQSHSQAFLTFLVWYASPSCPEDA